MNRVNLGEDPGYSESKHPILKIHSHPHGLRGNSLSHHTPGTQRRGHLHTRKNEQSLREAARKSRRSQLERSQGFTNDVGQRSSDEWLSTPALKRAVIVHLLQVGDEPHVSRLRKSLAHDQHFTHQHWVEKQEESTGRSRAMTIKKRSPSSSGN